jgi:general secretion pathway protein G
MPLKKLLKIIKVKTNNSRLFNRAGSGIVESLIVFIIISVLVVVVYDRYQRVIWEARKAALQTELGGLRQSISFFYATKGRYPKSLNELVSERIVVPYKDTVIRANYAEPYAVDKDMNILDPFDLPLAYDPLTGKVWSRKEGFENW